MIVREQCSGLTHSEFIEDAFRELRAAEQSKNFRHVVSDIRAYYTLIKSKIDGHQASLRAPFLVEFLVAAELASQGPLGHVRLETIQYPQVLQGRRGQRIRHSAVSILSALDATSSCGRPRDLPSSRCRRRALLSTNGVALDSTAWWLQHLVAARRLRGWRLFPRGLHLCV